MPKPTDWMPRNRPARGHLRFDRRFPALGVPRLQRSSETSDPSVFRTRDHYLTRLAELGCAAELQAFASGEVTIADIARAFEESNVRGFLAQIRAQLQTTVAPNAISVNEIQISPSVARPAPSEDLLADQLDRPMWLTSLQEVIPSMDRLEDTSRRRYLTAMRAFRLKSHLFSLSDAAIAAIEDLELSADQRDAIEFARSRGVTISRLRRVLALPRADQLKSLREDGIRLGDSALQHLRRVSTPAWRVLGAGADWIPDLETVDRVSLLIEADRRKLRSAAVCLGPDATYRDLARLSAGDWKRFSRYWGGSAADWNHTRRTLSAVLSTLLDTHRTAFRQKLIDNIPLLTEHERVPDITPAILLEIVAKLPVEAMRFPIALVLTGARISEYERITRADLRPHTYKVKINGTKTNASIREVHVAPVLWHFVDEAVPAPHTAKWLRHVWREACAATDVYGVTLHDLRHCHGQWALMAGAQEQSVQTTLGHSSPAMTRRYTRTLQRGEVAEALARTLQNMLKP
jgi:integrase